MHSLRSFWNDETGSIISAELVTIGAVVTVGAVTGLQAVSSAVDDELRDVNRALRNLDQSYSYRGFRGCNSMTAGSAYVDTSVDVAGDRPEKRLENKPSKNQDRSSAESSDGSPEAAQIDFDDLDELEASEVGGPVTSAEEKL